MSPILGGRTEVIKAPFVELLKHIELLNQKLEAESKKEQLERYVSFLSLFYAHPLVEAKERKMFMEILKPNLLSEQEIPEYDTDIELLKQLKAMQKGG